MVEFISEAIWGWCFLCGKTFNYKLMDISLLLGGVVHKWVKLVDDVVRIGRLQSLTETVELSIFSL